MDCGYNATQGEIVAAAGADFISGEAGKHVECARKLETRLDKLFAMPGAPGLGHIEKKNMTRSRVPRVLAGCMIRLVAVHESAAEEGHTNVLHGALFQPKSWRWRGYSNSRDEGRRDPYDFSRCEICTHKSNVVQVHMLYHSDMT